MGRRPYDVVVFGASGFTGSHVAAELIEQTRRITSSNAPLRVALAGRSEDRVRAAVARHCFRDGDANRVDVLRASVDDEASLRQMCASTRLVLNCVGPYRLYGEPVVKMCIEAKTDVLDLSGEPEWIERMELEYDDSAREAGCLVVSAAAFDSVPADFGVIFASRQFKERFGPLSVPTHVEGFMAMRANGASGPMVHYPTYECAARGVASSDSLRKLRKRARQPRFGGVGPRARRRQDGEEVSLRADGGRRSVVVSFIGADASVVRRTQGAFSAAKEGGLPSDVQPVTYAAYLLLPSKYAFFLYRFFGAIFFFLASAWPQLLLRFPKFFSHGIVSKRGPSAEMLRRASFSITFITRGFRDIHAVESMADPDLELVTRVAGPEPGYVATSKIFVQCALCVLLERHRTSTGSEAPRGNGCLASGVTTAGIAFVNTSLIERLQSVGITFEVLDDAIASPL